MVGTIGGNLGPENIFSVNAVAFKPDGIGNKNIESMLEQGEQITPNTRPSPKDFSIYQATGARGLQEKLTMALLQQNQIGTRVNILASYLVPLVGYSLYMIYNS